MTNRGDIVYSVDGLSIQHLYGRDTGVPWWQSKLVFYKNCIVVEREKAKEILICARTCYGLANDAIEENEVDLNLYHSCSEGWKMRIKGTNEQLCFVWNALLAHKTEKDPAKVVAELHAAPAAKDTPASKASSGRGKAKTTKTAKTAAKKSAAPAAKAKTAARAGSAKMAKAAKAKKAQAKAPSTKAKATAAAARAAPKKDVKTTKAAAAASRSSTTKKPTKKGSGSV